MPVWQEEEGHIPAWTMPETSERMAFGSFVSRPLTVTVTSRQDMLCTVVLRKWSSLTSCFSTSTEGLGLRASMVCCVAIVSDEQLMGAKCC